ncbi:MAG TPA: pilus assembly protein TadC [Bdellovibrionales bacterium]|nr:pilus assembly protein TadC [Pseudobdellovibrionaceae bacterium]HAG92160.1 pilus assembly protein TadC [Bdellovibrionales bacterium]|tara:strand:- start:244 stop:1149 length:906 start_codon:yes stop_codon:yes gene_type:complete
MLSFDFLILISGLGLAALSVYLFTSAIFTNNADAEALAWASGDEPAKSKNALINLSRPLIHNFTLQHARKIKSESYRSKVRKKILTAGLSEEINEDEFIGLQILWGIMFPIGFTIFNFALQMDFPYFVAIGISGVGFLFPHLYCGLSKGKRYTDVVCDLPFFIDLMALSTEAGLDFMGSLQRIVDKADNSVLADELQLVLKDIKLGSSRREALTRLSDRLDIPEITSFVAVVRDAEETGASIAQVLKDQSIQMRLERFVRAEKAGAKASQAMLIPMMFLVLPSVFIMVFAPVVLNFFYGGQ